VAPAVDAGVDASAYANVPFHHAISFADPGSDADWMVSVDWNGDGDFLDDGEVAFATGSRELMLAHTYGLADIGNAYNVAVQVGDGDGGVDVDIFQVLVGETFTADFNFDGNVDGADLSSWQLGFGAGPGADPTQGDEDRDGVVDGADFLAWQLQQGVSVFNAVAAGAVQAEGAAYAVEPDLMAFDAAQAAGSAEDMGAAGDVASAGWWLSADLHAAPKQTAVELHPGYDAAFDRWAAPTPSYTLATDRAWSTSASADETSAIEWSTSARGQDEAFMRVENALDSALASWLDG
jgi:hypothetical protein